MGTELIYKENPMYAVYDKDTIKNEILSHLYKAKRGLKFPIRSAEGSDGAHSVEEALSEYSDGALADKVSIGLWILQTHNHSVIVHSIENRLPSSVLVKADTDLSHDFTFLRSNISLKS